jgi:coenzyme F420-0:L-glutamate ligase / coenzyme F420-1:gamma-L-glutamate ligase
MTLRPPEPTVASDFADTLLTRRSIRAFRDEPLPADAIEDLLRIAVWSPSPHNAQPWRFTIVLTPSAKERLAAAMAQRLAEELEADGLPLERVEQQTRRSSHRISTAPAVVLCSLVRDGLAIFQDDRRNDLEWQMAIQSVGSVLQSLFLAAHARSIGSCWMAAPMYCPDVVRATLGLPADFAPQALVLMGYPAGPGRVRERRPIEEIVDIR